jgi:hypothetical protein
MNEAFETLVRMEEDLHKAISKANNLKSGIRKGSISTERQIEIINEIIKEIER